jgi:hypothetical protein
MVPNLLVKVPCKRKYLIPSLVIFDISIINYGKLI